MCKHLAKGTGAAEEKHGAFGFGKQTFDPQKWNDHEWYHELFEQFAYNYPTKVLEAYAKIPAEGGRYRDRTIGPNKAAALRKMASDSSEEGWEESVSTGKAFEKRLKKIKEAEKNALQTAKQVLKKLEKAVETAEKRLTEATNKAEKAKRKHEESKGIWTERNKKEAAEQETKARKVRDEVKKKLAEEQARSEDFTTRQLPSRAARDLLLDKIKKFKHEKWHPDKPDNPAWLDKSFVYDLVHLAASIMEEEYKKLK